MNTQEPRNPLHGGVIDPLTVTSSDTLLDSPSAVDVRDLERQVEYIVDDCFFTVGQVVGMRTTVDWEAVVWWRDHYRQKFLGAMTAFGNRWLQDRSNVTSVAIMLAERAVRYSEGKPSIDAEAARKAAADVERHCALHARRAARRQGLDPSDTSATRIAGYWCTW
ncbi:MAG TPA: hypothetical protein VFB92_24435 [Vicinamibacterales bacterium]|nr:hypothetical protein [Vicinamibacterales bacterium]